MTLKAIRVLTPYLDRHTLESLRDELWAGITEHHRRSREKPSQREYELTPFVEGRRYTVSYAVDALVAVAEWEALTAEQVRGLVEVLAGTPFDRMGGWKVLARHGWRPEDLPAAQRLLDNLDLPATRWDLDDVVDLLGDLARVYAEEPAFGNYLLAALQNEELRQLDPRTRWLALLQTSRAQATTYVREKAFSYFAGIVDDLKCTSGEEAITLNWTHPVRFLPLLLENYPEALGEEQRRDLVEGLFDALPNENIYVTHKVAMLTALRLSWKDLSPELRESATGRLRQLPEAAALVRVIDREGPGYAPTPAPVQLQRLLLHAELGLLLLPGDELTLSSTLVTGHDPDLTSALEALGLLLQKGHVGLDRYLPGLIAASQGEGRPAGHALYLLIRFIPEHGHPWRSVIEQLMSAAAQAVDEHLALAVISGLNALPGDHDLRRSSAGLVQRLKAHAHRVIREGAEALDLSPAPG
ncbi:hypothetical protein [Deinococcus aestuarii]|uniref:hypothetical protein n=1 Tax=Deinococcus aestuarii TaxID=2774531 RepID=UPI001C0D0011|nr:hypothetical protein [Deinococcus aestuarii]